MDASQPFTSSLKSSTALVEPIKAIPEPIDWNSNSSVDVEVTTQQAAPMVGGSDCRFLGILEVFIHQARDIHNICIYHKQDVYAKLCLTSDPEVTVSSQIINGGGKNPVFNDTVRLNVRTTDSFLKCEIWMMSRVKNYLQDQLLGFALVPLSNVVIRNGKKMVQEFPLSSTDLFHSPAGFVQLSLSYFGSSPDVIVTAIPPTTLMEDANDEATIPCEFDNIEFPDLKVVNENQMMVSEYFGISCTDLDSQNPENSTNSENCESRDDSAGVLVVESFSTENSVESVVGLKEDTPLSSDSTNGSPVPIPATSQSFSNPSGVVACPPAETAEKDKIKEAAECEADSSDGHPNKELLQPIIDINIEPKQTVVQQDIVDMYMKSMQQFTESLAKMKLPMDLENKDVDTENSNSGKLQASKPTGSRVFYGSRAFF